MNNMSAHYVKLKGNVYQIRQLPQKVANRKNTAGAMVSLGNNFFHEEKFSKAEECYRSALEIDPDCSVAHFGLAITLDTCYGWFKRVEARMHYLEALRVDPRCSEAHYNLALLYQVAGNKLAAVSHFLYCIECERGRVSPLANTALQEVIRLSKETKLKVVPKPASLTEWWRVYDFPIV